MRERCSGCAIRIRIRSSVSAYPHERDDATAQIGPQDRYSVDDETIRWTPIAADTAALTSLLTFADDSPDDSIEAVDTEDDPVRSGLVFRIDGQGLIQFPETYDDVQVDVELELIDYSGTVAPAHHIQSFERFEMFRFTDDGEGELIRRTDAEDDVLDAGSTDQIPDDTFELTVSASARHFYGRLNGEALAHGHASPEPTGGVGLFFDGTGTVRIHSVTITPI